MYVQVESVDLQYPIGEPETKSEDMTKSTEIRSHSTHKQLEYATGQKKTVLMTSSANVIAGPVMKSRLIQSQESKDPLVITCNDKIPPQTKVKLVLVDCVGSGSKQQLEPIQILEDKVRDSMENAAEKNIASTMDESFPKTHETARQQQLGADTTSAPGYGYTRVKKKYRGKKKFGGCSTDLVDIESISLAKVALFFLTLRLGT
jgi:hypothetical protein